MTLVVVAAAALLALWWLAYPLQSPTAGLASPTVTATAAPSGGDTDVEAIAVAAAPATTVVRADETIPQVGRRQPAAAKVNVWQLDPSAPDALFDGAPAKRLQADPEVVGNLHVGQVLSLDIPHINASLLAEITTTANLTPRTQVWEGAIIDGQPLDNVVVARGQLETHVTIITSTGSYLAVIDNATGEALMVDEADITENQIPFDDGIAVQPVPHQHPPATR